MKIVFTIRKEVDKDEPMTYDNLSLSQTFVFDVQSWDGLASIMSAFEKTAISLGSSRADVTMVTKHA